MRRTRERPGPFEAAVFSGNDASGFHSQRDIGRCPSRRSACTPAPSPGAPARGLRSREPQAQEAEKKRPVQSRLVGPKRLLEDAPVIELELQMKLREREALSVELLQQIVEKLLDEEQKTLGRRLRRGKLHLAEEDLLLGLGLKGREELSGREAMEIVPLGAETFQEPLGRQAKEVRHGANVELEERLLRVGRDVEPRGRDASAYGLFFFETLKGAGAATGPGDGVGPDAGKSHGD